MSQVNRAIGSYAWLKTRFAPLVRSVPLRPPTTIRKANLPPQPIEASTNMGISGVEQERRRKTYARWRAQQAAIEEATRQGKLAGLEFVQKSERQSFKRWMRGKVLRSLFIQIGDEVYAPSWMLGVWNVRHGFAAYWTGQDRVPSREHVGEAWNALRRLVGRAARDKALAEYVDACVRLDGARGLIAPAREAMAKKERGE